MLMCEQVMEIVPVQLGLEATADTVATFLLSYVLVLYSQKSVEGSQCSRDGLWGAGIGRRRGSRWYNLEKVCRAQFNP